MTKTLYGREEGTARTLNFAYTPEGWLLSEIGRKQNQEAGSASDWETRNERLFTDEYIWLGGRPLAKLTRRINANGVTKKAEVSYLHTDHLATPRRATNDNGQTVWQWNSDGFGAKRADRDPDGDGVKTHVRLYISRSFACAHSSPLDASPVNTMTAKAAYTTTTTATMTLKRAVTSNPTQSASGAA